MSFSVMVNFVWLGLLVLFLPRLLTAFGDGRGPKCGSISAGKALGSGIHVGRDSKGSAGHANLLFFFT